MRLDAGAQAGSDDRASTVSGTIASDDRAATSVTLTSEDDVTAEWWYGARLSVSPGSVSENGGKQLVTVTAEVSEWGTSTNDLSYEVTVGKGGDGAVSGTDYKAVSKFKINIKANRRSGSNSSTWSRSATPTGKATRRSPSTPRAPTARSRRP